MLLTVYKKINIYPVLQKNILCIRAFNFSTLVWVFPFSHYHTTKSWKKVCVGAAQFNKLAESCQQGNNKKRMVLAPDIFVLYIYRAVQWNTDEGQQLLQNYGDGSSKNLLRYCLASLLRNAHLSLISEIWSIWCKSFDSWYTSSFPFDFPGSKLPLILAASARRSCISISVVLAVIPLRYQEMGGGGTMAGWISCSKVTIDAILPLPLVHEW